jgi:lambda family phage minor tail protein L
MPRTLDPQYLTKKNAQTNEPIWLFRVNIDPADLTQDLFLAAYSDNVEYFKGDDSESSGYSAQTYTKFPIKHDGIGENTEGQIDSLRVTVANVSREMQAYVELHSGLRGNKVTIWHVFYDLLSDMDAHTEFIFYVDSCRCDQNAIEFTLSTKFDILSIEVPRRKYYRNRCQWTYKGSGCYVAGSPPSGFSTNRILLLPADQTIPGYLTKTLYAGEKYGAGNPAICAVGFNPVNCFGLVKASAGISLYIRCDDPTRIAADSQIEVTSSHTYDQNEWAYVDLSGLGIGTTWTLIEIPFTSFVTTGGDLDVENINYFRTYIRSTGGSNAISIKNAQIKYVSTISIAHAWFNAVNCTGLVKASDYLYVDIRCDGYAGLTADSQIEITSSGTCDDEEWTLADLAQMASYDVGGKSITDAWQTFQIPLSLFSDTGGGLDITNVNFMRMYANASAGNIYLEWKNPKFNRADTCNKSITECRQHNNLLRFGGFPAIPAKR